MIGSIDHFVDQQISLWQEERRIAERKGVHGHTQRPMICISREYGARGAAMGRMIADRLGFRYYSQELVHDIAEQAHVRQQVIESLDERVQDGIAEWVAGLIKRSGFAPTDYLRNLSRVVLTLGRHGKGVIIGRGAHFLLDAKATLRDDLSEAEAHAKVVRIDGERVAFNRLHHNADIADPSHYDLVVNAGTLGVEGAAEQTIHAFRFRFG
jgi:cytidylate kinase